MKQSNAPDRRAFMKWVSALPLLSYFAAQGLIEKASAASTYKSNIYTRIGLKPIINARGTWTYTSASLELPEVKAAKTEASRYFVDMWELQRAVGVRLAELSGAESGMVTAGAAAAMATATAACIAGTDPAMIWQLPDTTGLKHEVIMFGGRISFDSGIRAVGGKLVIAMTHDELKAAINDKTAMIYTTVRDQELEGAIAIAKDTKIPLMVDWAAGIPPIENLSIPAKLGADLYTFSGGKGMCGPQCSGLLLGRKDLIEAALANSSPWEGAVCRPMKVGKEEIMGCLAAVETWKKRDLAALDREWTRRIKRVEVLVQTVPGVTTEIYTPPRGNRYPTLSVVWDENALGITVAEVAKKMRYGDPPIEILWPHNPSTVPGVRGGDPKAPPRPPSAQRPGVQICSMTLQPGEEIIVGRRLREILNDSRKLSARAARRGAILPA